MTSNILEVLVSKLMTKCVKSNHYNVALVMTRPGLIISKLTIDVPDVWQTEGFTFPTRWVHPDTLST